MVTSGQVQHDFSVALDAMGGDNAPGELVAGAVQVARQEGIRVLLVGDQTALKAELARHDVGGLPITLVPSVGIIQETDQPMQAMRDKPNASVVEAAKLVKAGQAQAMVTMGSTGAAMVTSTLVLGLMDGVERPAIGGPLLRPLSPAVIIDLGTNLDCRSSQLLGFAAIGAAYSHSIQGVENPRVALLSVGTEEGKGNRQIREAYPLFVESGLNFVGNVEGVDFFLDKADVVVCDGFVGNILMKFAEGLGMAIAQQLPGMLGQHLSPQALEQVTEQLSTFTNIVEVSGGGPIFGVDGMVIVGHGRSHAASVAGAIGLAKQLVESGLLEAMRRELASLQRPEKE